MVKPVEVTARVGTRSSGFEPQPLLPASFRRPRSGRRRPEEKLRPGAGCSELISGVLLAANEASTLEGAFKQCLQRVCAYTGWPLGHALVADPGARQLVSMGLWHPDDRQPFASFCEITEAAVFPPGCGLPGEVLISRKPAWVVDMSDHPTSPRAREVEDLRTRTESLRPIRVRASFAFPILVGREVAAALEFFSTDAAEVDEALLEVMAEIGTQIGLVVERCRAKTILTESKRLLANAEQIARLGSWEWNVRSGSATWSDELYRIFGLEPHELAASYEALVERCHPEDRAPLQMAVEESLRSGMPFELQLRVARADGEERVVDARGEIARDVAGSRVVCGTAHDVTERKGVETALARHASDLERSNAELERFASVASHDLQEPLRMVANYVGLLARRYQGRLDEDADDFIGYAVEGATRMQMLIDALLEYAHVGGGEDFSVIRCEDTLLNALANLRGAIDHRAALVTHDKLPSVLGDASQLTQLFQNLIGNAIKFSEGEPSRVHVGVTRQGREWLFSVSDNGIGIDREDVGRIFEIFARLHPREKYEGSGIGLCICKKVVELHGGRIWAEPNAPSGSVFFFTLPTMS